MAQSSEYYRNYRCIRAERLARARKLATHTKLEWLKLMAEFDFRCVQCGDQPDEGPSKDHIIPIYQGGSDGIDNLQPLCRTCNAAKGPDTFNFVRYRRAHGWKFAQEAAGDGKETLVLEVRA